MPGQKIDDSAQASIEVTLLWAECNADRTVSQRQGGMITLSLCVMMPSTVERWFLNWKYSCKFGGSWWRESFNPDSVKDRNWFMLLVLAVAIRT